MKGKFFQLIVIVLGLYLVVVAIKGVWGLRNAGGRVETARQELAAAKETNRELKARLEEVKSDTFVEKEAREKLGLQKPGELVVVFEGGEEQVVIEEKGQNRELATWEKWWKLFF